MESHRLLGDLRAPAPFDSGVLAAACAAAVEVLGRVSDDQHAIDQALQCLAERAGSDLLVSVYGQQLERLWLIAQRGYDQVRDGFGLGEGVMARAVRTGSLQVVSDSAADEDFIAATSALRSEIAIPLGNQCPADGVFNVETRVGVLDERHLRPLQKVADGIAGRLARALEPQADDMASLARLFVYASSLRTLAATAELAGRSVGRLLGAESVQVNLRQGHSYLREESFWRPRDTAAEPLPSALIEELSSREPADAALSLIDLESYGLADADGPHFAVWLPLRANGETIGVIAACFSAQPPQAEGRAEKATLLAAHFAALIDGAIALEREREAANKDPLTDLLNRRGFEAALAERYALGPSEQPRSLLLIDCDDLKLLNSRGGHRLGDRALEMIAAALRSTSRSTDLVARIGGDEFAMLCERIDLDQTAALAERVRRCCEESYLPSGKLTVSIGYASTLQHAQEGLRDAADAALFDAKRRGKNTSATSPAAA